MAVASSTARSSRARAAIAATVAALAVVACDKGREPAPATEAAAQGAPPLASKAFYRVDAKPLAPCSAGATCEAQLVLTALGDYHVNGDYPTKFVADATASADVTVDSQGTFTLDGAKRGTLTVRFKPAKPGPAQLVGTIKLSVCNDDNCEIEAPKITLDVVSG